MTDPFADLERELLGAHARDSAARRRRPAVSRVAAVTASLAAVGLAFAVLATLSGGGDPERAASPQGDQGGQPYAPFEPDSGPAPGRDPDADDDDQPGVTPVDGCAGVGFVPPESQEPVPAEIRDLLGIYRSPATSAARPDPRMIGRSASRVYKDGHRVLPPAPDRDVYAVAAEVLPRKQVGRSGHPCDPPKGDLQPGVCLVLENDDGATSSCFALDEVRAGTAYLDTDVGLIGFAPDGVRTVESEGETAEIQANSFRLAIGHHPGTNVEFRE